MIGRREFLSLGAAAWAGERRPNIVLILADDLGYGELSCYGQKRYRTPNIDRIAAEGARFTDHYAGAPMCAPSRCCLLTGLHAGHARVRNNFTPSHGRAGLLRSDRTVVEALKESGYRTGIFGKWGLGEEGTEGTPNRKGFDEFFGFLNQNDAHNHYPEWLWRNAERVRVGGREYAQDLLTREGLRFIGENAARSYFLFMAYTLPHADLTAPEEYLARFRGKFGDEPNERFAAMMTKLDDDVGKLMRAVDDNTLVIFAGDNGPHSKGRDPKVLASAGPLRGVKGDVYEGGIRIPMMARWPGRIRAGHDDSRGRIVCGFSGDGGGGRGRAMDGRGRDFVSAVADRASATEA